MNDFVFEQAPWEAYLRSCKNGSVISGWNLISMLEDEEDDAVEDAFSILTVKKLQLDLSGLPQMSAGSNTAQRLQQEREYVTGGLKTALMEETDPLRLYLEEIAAAPACGDERLLAEQLSSGDQRAAQRLTELGLSRVVEIAAEYAGQAVLLLDLIQEGNIGLWEAISGYRGGDYAAQRDEAIRSSVLKAIVLQARSNGISQKMKKALQDYRAADQHLLTKLGRNPGLEEIAQEMHISLEQAQTIEKTMADILLLQKAEKLAAPKEETAEDELPVEDTAYFQMRQRISEMMSVLDEQEARILTMRFGLEKGLPMSAEEVAKALGITTAAVTACETAALSKLRAEK
jgi:RNA polymerase sigma factor rpoD